MLPPGRWLFLFAHPDDDVLIAGSIFTLAAQGHPVHLAWLTDTSSLGGKLHRQGEARAAARALGVEQLHFLDLPSLELVPNLDRSASQIAELMGQVRPDHIMTVAFEAGHIDHDCVNFLAYEARQRSGLAPPLFEYPLYNGSGGWFHINRFPPGPPAVRWQPLSEAARRCKRRAMRLYASQWPYMIPAWLATGRLWAEPYRICPPQRDHSQPPHPGTLNLDRVFNRFMRYRFADFAREVARVRSATSNPHNQVLQYGT